MEDYYGYRFYTHKDNLGIYVSDNIEAINTKISDFKKTNAAQAVYDDIDIKDYLKNKLAEELPAVKNAMLARFAGYGFQKNKIVDVANEFVFYKKDIENIFVSLVLRNFKAITMMQCVTELHQAYWIIVHYPMKKSDF